MNEIYSEYNDTIVDTIKVPKQDTIYLEKIERLDLSLKKKYEPYMHIDNTLNRKIVSFQANKEIPFYRWYKL